MQKNGMNDLGDKIKKTIDNAVETGNYQNLSRSISEIVGDAVDVKLRTKQFEEWQKQQERVRQRTQEQFENQQRQTSEANARAQQQFREQQRRTSQQNQTYRKQWGGQSSSNWKAANQRQAQQRPVNKPAANQPYQSKKYAYTQAKPSAIVSEYCMKNVPIAGPIVQIVGGAIGVTTFGILSMITLISSSVTSGSPVAGILFLALTGLTGVLTAVGVKKLQFINKFKKMAAAVGTQTTVPIKNLAKAVNQSVKKTAKDLKKMVEKNWFFEGHVDEQENYFLLSNKSYQEYQSAKLDLEQKQVEEARRKAAEESLPDEVQSIIEEGRSHVAHIRKCNDDIPDEVLSAKLDYMEMIVSRIFDEVKAHPENARDMRKMMNYYLPTTAKLLDAYKELDHQPIQGDNISTTKKEIEDSIDLLNAAFERFFDSMYADRAMDISTDISVLNTMLAQEGLKESAFDVGMDVKTQNDVISDYFDHN